MEEKKASLNFIEEIIEQDLENAKHDGRIHTRFPPEPNGFLHIGHAKAICLNFEIAKKYGGKTNLRFDDTNPTTEETVFVDAIKKDIAWLGFDWEDRLYYASDYFSQLYQYALKLINDGNAYIDDSTPDQIAAMKGSPTEVGTNSPSRDRSIEENLRLFEEMKAGQHPDGSMVLRAKIDMAAPNLLLRDPVIYRIKKQTHHRTGDDWCIYPMYDFAHGQSDAIEEITHSLCSLEFRHHRDLYNWLIEKLEIFPSRQIEFSRMNVAYMITSKRKLLKLVQGGMVTGWDDPRMPTLSGLRRKGYPASAIRVFCSKVGMTRRENLIEIQLLESCVRSELNRQADRVMVVLDPLKVIITNYPEGEEENLKGLNNPEAEVAVYRDMPFGREIYIERKDFMIDPPKKFYRMGPGRNVRLKHAYILHCEDYKTGENGEVEEVHCSYFDNTKSGEDNSGIKAKGVLHWVNAPTALSVQIRNYDRLFTDPTPDGHEDKDFLEFVNPDSLEINDKALAEPSLLNAVEGDTFQFMRNGYYSLDRDSTEEKKIFNSTISLKDSYNKK